MIAPVNGPISQRFGEDPAWYKANVGTNGHNGLDFAVPVGTPVVAPMAGTITRVGADSANGNLVVMRSASGYTYWFVHLSRQVCSVGQTVTQGQTIAYSGNTGLSTGPHLHFGLYPPSPNTANGFRGAIDPFPFIESPVTQGANEVFNNLNEVREAYMQMRGAPGTDAEMSGWIGQSKQRWIQVSTAETNQLRQALADVRKALANEEAKPPREVVKIVTEIVEKPVEVIKTVEVIKEVEPTWLSAVRDFINKFLNKEK